MACRNVDKSPFEEDEPVIVDTGDPLQDFDGDGYYDDEDCNDRDATISPAATEICDGYDNDCDGAIDEEVLRTFFADSDGDGFGDAEETMSGCEPEDGWVSTSDDCDDDDGSIHPGASERCDGVDNDCDDIIDEDVLSIWYADADGDGFGDPEGVLEECDPPSGYVDDDSDCDDADAEISPVASEVCDEFDNDCDGEVDEGVTITFYEDVDGDGFGHPGSTTEDCSVPAGYSSVATDCDDTDADISPIAEEWCDEIDNDCDGSVDEDGADAETWYADLDGDGFGDPDNSILACSAPSGYLDDNQDCADTDADAYPGSTATETPGDGIDTDCDGIDACTDLNCDGVPDLAIGSYYSGTGYSADSILFFGTGSDFNDTDVSEITGAGVRDVLVEDLDGDGYMDVVLPSYYSGSSYYSDSYVYWGGPSGYSASNREDIETGGAYSVMSADLNSDGYLDLVFSGYYVGSYYSYSYVYYGSSRGYSSGALDVLYTPGAVRTVAEDLDGDGDLDLVSCRHYAYTYDLSSYIFWNDGGGFSDSDRTDLATHGCYDVEVEDLDGDGWYEILFSSYYNGSTGYSTNGQIYWGSSSGYSSSDLTELPTTGSLSLATGDFNGDGATDVAFGSYYSGSSYTSNAIVYYGDGTGYDASQYDTLTSVGTWRIQAADLDLDGYDDLVLPSHYSDSGYSTLSYVYFGDSTGIGGSPDILSTHAVTDVGIGDLDGNGYPELVFNQYYSGSWSTLVGSTVYWGDGSGYSGSDSTSLDTAGTWARPVLVGSTDWE